MCDRQTLDHLKNQYRPRYYGNRLESLPDLPPGTNVLSFIRDYFKVSGDDESVTESSCSDTLTPDPDSIRKVQTSLENPCVSKWCRHHLSREVTDSKSRVASSPRQEQGHFNTFDVNNEDSEDSETNRPLDLTDRSKPGSNSTIKNVLREQIYGSDSSVLQRPSSPTQIFALNKRNLLRDYKTNKSKDTDQKSFSSLFSNIANNERILPSSSVDIPVHPASSLEVEDEEFVISDITEYDRVSVNWKTNKFCTSSKTGDVLQNKKCAASVCSEDDFDQEIQTIYPVKKTINQMSENRKSKKSIQSEKEKWENTESKMQKGEKNIQSETQKGNKKIDSKKQKGEKHIQSVVHETFTIARNNLDTPPDESRQLSGEKEKNVTETEESTSQTVVSPEENNQNEHTFSRPKRKSVPPSNWWAVLDRTFEIQPKLPPKKAKKLERKSKALVKRKGQNRQANSNQKDEKRYSHQKELFLEEYEDKSSETSNRKRKLNNLKYSTNEKMAEEKRAKHCEADENGGNESSSAFNVDVCDKPDVLDKTYSNDCDRVCFSTTVESEMSEQIAMSPQKLHPSVKKGPRISLIGNKELECLQNSKSPEDQPLQPNNESPELIYTSPTNHSINNRLSFHSGPVFRTKRLQCTDQVNLVGDYSPDNHHYMNLSPLAIVFDPDTKSEALAECIRHSDSSDVESALTWKSFNNNIFSAGKFYLRPMDEEVRDSPSSDILVFYIIKGNIRLKLHNFSHNLNAGDFFYIPPSNTFRIQNIQQESAELVYTQLKPSHD